MTIGKLHINIVRSGIGVLWLNPNGRGTWHWAMSWVSPAMQAGAINKRGYGGMLWDSKGYRRLGVWRPSESA